ncbi:UNVERIFIED_CONTAM: hypothetical protein RMT77_010709 [Armadillidium vulgare]
MRNELGFLFSRYLPFSNFKRSSFKNSKIISEPVQSEVTYPMNFYEILGVNADASEADIRKNYQELARKYHPDKCTDATSKENFIKVTEAWQVLGDARKRKEYDDQLKREELYQKFPISEELFIEDLVFNTEKDSYNHTCRCGGSYEITTEMAESAKDKEIAVVCNSCSLAIIVILKCEEHNGT